MIVPSTRMPTATDSASRPSLAAPATSARLTITRAGRRGASRPTALWFRFPFPWYSFIGGSSFSSLTPFYQTGVRGRHLKFHGIRDILSLEEAKDKIKEYGTPQEFANHFEEFNSWSKDHSVIGPLWQEYAETLILPEDEANTVIYQTVGAHVVFNDATVIQRNLDLRFYNAFPNYLTGAGILGTFIGLVAGIYLAQEGLASNDMNLMRQALGQLLGGASAAFWTSIVGLGCSIAFSTLEKSWIHSIQKVIGEFNKLLNERVLYISIEQLSHRALNEAQSQTRELRRFNNELAVSIATALDEKLAGRLSPALDKLIHAVEGLRTDRASSNEQALKNMIDEFRSTLIGATGTEMKALAGTMEGLNEGLRSISEALAQSRQGLLDGLECGLIAFLQGTEDMTKQLATGIAPLQDSIESLSKVVEMARETMQEGQRMGERWVDISSKATGEVAASLSHLQDTHEKVHFSIRGLSGATEKMNSLLESFADGILALQTVSNQMVETSASLKRHTDRITEVWDDQRVRFEGLDESLANAFEVMNSGVQGYIDRVQKFAHEMDSLFGKAIQDLGGAIGEFEESITNLQEVLVEHKDPSSGGAR